MIRDADRRRRTARPRAPAHGCSSPSPTSRSYSGNAPTAGAGRDGARAARAGLCSSTSRCPRSMASRCWSRSAPTRARRHLRHRLRPYAVRAFEVHALDYLLKPFDAAASRRRWRAPARSCPRAARRGGFEQRLIDLLEDLNGEKPPRKRLVVNPGPRDHFVEDRRDRLDRSGRQLRPPPRRRHSHLLRETMKGMEEALDPRHFIRIHGERAVSHLSFATRLSGVNRT